MNKLNIILEYIFNPGKLLGLFWNWTVQFSYIACLLICIGSIMLYVAGCKKSGKWATISLGVYTIIQAIGSAFK